MVVTKLLNIHKGIFKNTRAKVPRTLRMSPKLIFGVPSRVGRAKRS